MRARRNGWISVLFPSVRVASPVVLGILSVLLLIAPGVIAGESVVDHCEQQQWDDVSSIQLTSKQVEAAQPDGMTALHWAVHFEHVPTVERLLGAGADANAVTEYGVSPLAIACQNGNERVVAALVAAGADVAFELPGGETMLMRAARTGDLDVVELLLDAGADVRATERLGQSALMWAAAAGHADVVDQLLKAGADVNRQSKSGFTAMFFASRNGHIDACLRLLEAGVDVNDTIRPASTSGRNPRNRMSALMFAVESGQFELALKLVELGADPNDQRSGFAPLHALSWVRRARRGDGVDGDPEPRVTGNVTDLDFVRGLVTAGVNVNLQLERGKGGQGVVSPKGATPLIFAAKTADLPLMKTLIECGADPTITNEDGTTPLLAAAGVGVKSLVDEDPGSEAEVIDAVKYLMSIGLDINAVDKTGETVMHGAAYRNYPHAVLSFAEAGADPRIWNKANQHKRTPTDIAAGKRPGAFKPSPETVQAIANVLGKSADGSR